MNLFANFGKGETIIAKPVLIVAIIDVIDSNVFANYQFFINDGLEGPYKMQMPQYAKDLQFDETTGIAVATYCESFFLNNPLLNRSNDYDGSPYFEFVK